MNFIVGTFLSMFWGLVLSLFIEYIDNTIKTPDDIKHIKSLNFLGAIPKGKDTERPEYYLKFKPHAARSRGIPDDKEQYTICIRR